MTGSGYTSSSWRAGPVLVAAVLAAALALVGGACAEAATLKGLRGSGLRGVPTGEGGPAGEFTVGLHTDVGDGATYTYVRYQLTDRVEVGLTSTNFGTVGFGLLATMRLVDEQGRLPAVAVGVEEKDVYAVAARALDSPFTRLHVGLRAPRAEDNSGYGPPLLFFGVTRVINPVSVRQPDSLGWPITTVGLEFDGRYLGGGLTLQLGPAIQLDLAVQDRGRLAFAVGVNVSTEF